MYLKFQKEMEMGDDAEYYIEQQEAEARFKQAYKLQTSNACVNWKKKTGA